MINKKGQQIVANLLFFFMAIVIVAVFMPTVKETITSNLPNVTTGINGTLVGFIVTFWPVFAVIMLLIILVVISRQ